MTTPTTPLAYIGPAGSSFGFTMAGMATHQCDHAEELLTLLRQFRDEGTYQIIFIDEGLATTVHEDIERLNQQTIPALILVSNPTNPQHIATEKMNRLIIKALGADILSN